MNERVVDFLYCLMRDHLIPGKVEEIVTGHVEYRDKSRLVDEMVYPVMEDHESCEFENKGLEQYARELAARLHV